MPVPASICAATVRIANVPRADRVPDGSLSRRLVMCAGLLALAAASAAFSQVPPAQGVPPGPETSAMQPDQAPRGGARAAFRKARRLWRKCHAPADGDDPGKIDPIPGFPPTLYTDDPGIPDDGCFETNFFSFADRAREVGTYWELIHADINYGIEVLGQGIQLKVEAPYILNHPADSTAVAGLGKTIFGIKIPFYESDAAKLSLAVYPQYENNGPAGSISRGVIDQGTSTILPLLISKIVEAGPLGEIGFSGNLGYVTHGSYDPQSPVADQLYEGIAASRVFGRTLLVVEYFHQADLHTGKNETGAVSLGVKHPADFMPGFVSRHYSSNVFAAIGRTLNSPDGVGHVQFIAGIQLLSNPDAATATGAPAASSPGSGAEAKRGN